MNLWKNPQWYDAQKREKQLDEHVRATGKAAFGLKAVDETDKADVVREHFNRVAEKYDFMNSLLSLGIQHVWKRAAVRTLHIKPGDRVLDLCGGTGDLALLAASRTGRSGNVVICDINRAMMQAGQNKIDKSTMGEIVSHVQGDAEALAFPDESFDVAMVGFGIRNLTHLKKGFREMHRVLKPGGKILCLEFSRPTNPVFRKIYDLYSFNVMPLLGKLIVGVAEPYAALPETIRMFPLPHELTAILRETGFYPVTFQPMTNSIAVAHTGVKTSR